MVAFRSADTSGRQSGLLLRCILYCLLAIGLMILDKRYDQLSGIRRVLSVVVYPLQIAITSPLEGWDWLRESFRTRDALRADKGRLEQELRMARFRLQRYDAMETEVRQLQALRENTAGVAHKFIVGDVMNVDLDAFRARIMVDKGARDGVFIEQLEMNPAQYLPAAAPELAPPVQINLNVGMDKVRAVLSKFPIKTRLSLTGTLIVARDAAHARVRQMLEAGEPMPAFFKDYPIYYAGPAKTPVGMASGSFGPTTAGRMDSFVDLFQSHGGSLITIAKGNRSRAVTDACKKHGGFYLGSIGGPAAILAQSNIKKVELLAFEEMGMEAVRKIEVVDFPAFIVVDDKGNDFFDGLG